MAYEALSKRDLSAVGDVVREAKLLADEDGASQVTFEHVKRAIHEVLIVSDVPWAEMEKRLQQQKLGRKASRQAPALEPEASPGARRDSRAGHYTPAFAGRSRRQPDAIPGSRSGAGQRAG